MKTNIKHHLDEHTLTGNVELEIDWNFFSFEDCVGYATLKKLIYDVVRESIIAKVPAYADGDFTCGIDVRFIFPAFFDKKSTLDKVFFVDFDGSDDLAELIPVEDVTHDAADSDSSVFGITTGLQLDEASKFSWVVESPLQPGSITTVPHVAELSNELTFSTEGWAVSGTLYSS